MPRERTAKPRGRPRAGEISGREALLAAALPLFARHGYEGMSLRTLAKAAGVDSALIARHFGSKAELWLAVIDRLAGHLKALGPALDALAQQAQNDPHGAFKSLIELLADLSRGVPEFPAYLLNEAANDGPRLRFIEQNMLAPFRAECSPIIGAAMQAQGVETYDCDLIFAMLMIAISAPLVGPALFLPGESCLNHARNRIAEAAIMLFCPSKRMP